MPFWFVKNPEVKSVHFDEGWSCKKIRLNQVNAIYKQKWNKATTTMLQIESSLVPASLKVLSRTNLQLKEFLWTAATSGVGYVVYQTIFDVSDLDDQDIFLYQDAGVLGEAISEPISIAVSHENVLLYQYKNSFNKEDTAWTTGLTLSFFCESDIQDYEPKVEKNDFVNQVHDTTLIDGTTYREFQLKIGDTKNGRSGVAEYVLEILNKIFNCDSVLINGIGYTAKTGSEIKVTRVPTYPLVGGTLDITPSKNTGSLEFQDMSPQMNAIVTTYNIETGFFGPAAIVPIIEVEENG